MTTKTKVRIKAANLEEIEIPFHITETDEIGMVECGFVENWITVAADDRFKGAFLEVGAGLGSPMMRMTIELTNGDRKCFRADIRPLLTDLIKRTVRKYDRQSRICGGCELSVVTSMMDPCENCGAMNWWDTKPPQNTCEKP